MNINKSTFPVQRLPMAKKGKQWKEDCVDGIIGRKGGGVIGGLTRKERAVINYDLYNSSYNEADLKYVTDPYKVEDGFPATLQEFNIIRPKIDLLLGEETKRPFNYRVIQTNDEVISELKDRKKELLMNYVLSGYTNQDAMNPEAIEKYMGMDYKSIVEENAYATLSYLTELLNLPHEFLKGWKDGLIGGEEIYYTGIINGDPVLERINPVWCDYDKDPDLDFIGDSDWFVREMQMTPSAIHDRLYDLMTDADLNKVLSLIDGSTTIKSPSDVNTKGIIWSKGPLKSLADANREYRDQLITVHHVVWRSMKKVGFITTTDEETGEEQVDKVDESYVEQADEKVEWEWITEIWEGYRVGDDIYIGIQPTEYQTISMDNPNAQSLPYTGVQYSNTNSRGKSLVSIMKPLQYMYIIIWYRLELALARDKGKILTMDITQIPKSMGVDVNKWMHYLTSLGVNFINPYEEGWDIPGREGGKPAAFNQMSQIDLTMSDVITGYIQLMEKIETMVGELSGVTRQREGSIHHRELVGNVERAVIQSSHITEPLFWTHNQAKKKALMSLLNTAKHAWARSGKKFLHYAFGDALRVFMDITEDFLYADLDIFLSDATKDEFNLQIIKSLLQPAMQQGASLIDAAEALTTDNLTKLKAELAELEAKRHAREQEAAQTAQQTQMQLREMEEASKAEDRRIQEEDSIRDSDTQIKVALIKAESAGDVIDEGYTEEAKLQLQKQKQTADIRKQEAETNVRKKLSDEDIRKNRKAEEQRQQEIEIKRKQANRSVTKSK